MIRISSNIIPWVQYRHLFELLKDGGLIGVSDTQAVLFEKHAKGMKVSLVATGQKEQLLLFPPVAKPKKEKVKDEKPKKKDTMFDVKVEEAGEWF